MNALNEPRIIIPNAKLRPVVDGGTVVFAAAVAFTSVMFAVVVFSGTEVVGATEGVVLMGVAVVAPTDVVKVVVVLTAVVKLVVLAVVFGHAVVVVVRVGMGNVVIVVVVCAKEPPTVANNKATKSIRLITDFSISATSQTTFVMNK